MPRTTVRHHNEDFRGDRSPRRGQSPAGDGLKCCATSHPCCVSTAAGAIFADMFVRLPLNRISPKWCFWITVRKRLPTTPSSRYLFFTMCAKASARTRPGRCRKRLNRPTSRAATHEPSHRRSAGSEQSSGWPGVRNTRDRAFTAHHRREAGDPKASHASKPASPTGAVAELPWSPWSSRTLPNGPGSHPRRRRVPHISEPSSCSAYPGAAPPSRLLWRPGAARPATSGRSR
jgi:hypothetical protein